MHKLNLEIFARNIKTITLERWDWESSLEITRYIKFVAKHGKLEEVIIHKNNNNRKFNRWCQKRGADDKWSSEFRFLKSYISEI